MSRTLGESSHQGACVLSVWQGDREAPVDSRAGTGTVTAGLTFSARLS